MIYLYAGIAVYLGVGAFLTHVWMLSGSTLRLHARDWILGAIVTPLIFFLTLCFIGLHALWVRLQILLDFEPEERPGSKAGKAP